MRENSYIGFLKLSQVKFYSFLIIGLLSGFSSSAQVSKIYVDSKGIFTADSRHARSYDLIEKLSDTAYQVRTYNMKDTILMEGTYKDELLKIPNGRFIYYSKKTIPEKFDGVIIADTNNFISMVGYFLNGLKVGMWVEYQSRGIKNCTYFYKKDMANGIYQRFDKSHNSYVVEEGNYIDDKREGEWNLYGYDTLKTPIKTAIYKNDRLVKEIVHIEAADFPSDLGDFFARKLKQVDTLKHQNVDIKIGMTIGINGKVTNPKIISKFSSQVTNTLSDAVQHISKFKPEMRDGKPVETTYILTLLPVKNYYAPDGAFDIILSKDVGNGMSFTRVHGLVVTTTSKDVMINRN